jgi:nuclear pore complex protein Nup205
VLRLHKSQFVSLLKNPIRNSSDAALVRKASSEGIKLSSGDGSSITQRLPPQMVDEAFIISDMFELNEISSLHLLLQGRKTNLRYHISPDYSSNVLLLKM